MQRIACFLAVVEFMINQLKNSTGQVSDLFHKCVCIVCVHVVCCVQVCAFVHACVRLCVCVRNVVAG